jgi:hypothetical protein
VRGPNIPAHPTWGHFAKRHSCHRVCAQQSPPPHTNHSSLAILPWENPKSKVVVQLGMVPIEKWRKMINLNVQISSKKKNAKIVKMNKQANHGIVASGNVRSSSKERTLCFIRRTQSFIHSRVVPKADLIVCGKCQLCQN